jgi:hypothetical protein
MGWVREFMSVLISLQDKFAEADTRFKDEVRKGSGNVCILQVKGDKGEMLKLKAQDGRFMFADDSDVFVHSIAMSEDTFIDIITGEVTLRDAYARGYVVFRGDDWLVHANKWADSMDEMGYLLNRYVGWGPKKQ